MLDVDDRDPRGAGPIQKCGRLVQGGLHPVEFHHAVGVGVLAVDEHQSRVGEADGLQRQTRERAQRGKIRHPRSLLRRPTAEVAYSADKLRVLAAWNAISADCGVSGR